MSARSSDTTLGRLIAPLVKPAVFDFWAAHLNAAWSWERPLAQVVARRIEAQGTVTLDLKANRHCGAIQPGQHVNISAEVNGRRVTRSYSPTQVSRSGKRLSITVKQIDGGKLSTHLGRHVRVGDALEVGPAFGDMRLQNDAVAQDGPLLFLAAGSGITPLISLTRALDKAGLKRALTLVYWARTRAELCFVAELRALAARQPLFQVHFVLTQEAQRLSGEHAERLNAELLASLVPDLAQRRVHACGPAGFVDTARALSTGQSRSFVGEAFTPPPALAIDDVDTNRTVQIKLALSDRTLTVPAGEALLPALEAQGLKLPSGCRMGICNTCSCPKQSGTTQHLHTGDREELPTSALRLCVSRACTDLTLDL